MQRLGKKIRQKIDETSKRIPHITSSRCSNDGWSVLYLGSAGHGNGKGKAKSTNDILETAEDLKDAKRYFNGIHMRESTLNLRSGYNKYGENIYQYGEIHVQGLAGSAANVLETIQEFLRNCEFNKLVPIIYYTGHGKEGTGDWCYPSGTISYADIRDADKKIQGKHWKPVLICDCCFSGNWVWHGQKDGIHVVAASDREMFAYNRQFAKAVFCDDDDAKQCLRNESHAIASKTIQGDSGVVWFSGFNSTWLEP